MTKASSRRSLLVVDDSLEDRLIIRRMLRDSGYFFDVTECETAHEAVERMRQARPDCVLLDFRLPDMTAIEWLDAVRGNAAAGDDHGGDQGGGSGAGGRGAARGGASGGGAADGGAGRRGGGLPERNMLPCPVAVLTGLDDREAAAAALGRGAQDYVVKGSLTAHGLHRVIENSIEKYAIQRDLEAKRSMLALRNRQLESIREQLELNLTELIDATRSKDRFMAVMSHEMRTPLNAVLGYADLLDMSVGGELNVTQRDYVERIRAGSRHLLDLINDVLDVARVDARKLELDLRPVDAVAVTEEVVALLASQAAAKEVRLEFEGAANAMPLVQADVNRLRQVITNLVGNAIKFTDAGTVTVSCRQVQDRVQVLVSDTGIGIDPDSLSLIFTEFYQADGDLTRRQGGTGLGLAISQRLAQLMGGEILVESRPGVGSCFTLALPLARRGSEARHDDVESHRKRMQAHRAAADEKRTPEAPRAMVVAYSDNSDGLEALGDQVFPGVELAWTTDVDEVPKLARVQNASLVVLDIGCDDGAGWNAAHALREDPLLAPIAVLLLPGLPQPLAEEVDSGLDLGWVTLVPKPFTTDQLTHAVQTAARGGMAAPGTEPVPIEVLIVDDDPDSRRVALSFLQAAHVNVREVEDGESALAEMRRRPPNVAVLDLMMPVLDGFGVLAAMRADPLLMHIPVVVLSAKSLSEAERQFLARSAVRVLQKGQHRLSDVAALVLRAAAGARAGE